MDKKIDIHTHVLFGVDDGAKTIEDSLAVIDYLKSIGIYDIVLTSHYIKDTKYQSKVADRNKLLKELKSKVLDKDVNLYLGNEVFMCDEVVDLYNKKEVTTLNKSRYMLVELPLGNYFRNYQNVLCEMLDAGIIPIMAHPERYKFIQKDKKKIKEMLEYGCLLQVNVDSLIGKYGKDAKKIAKWLLKKDLVTFVATDTHKVSNIKDLEKAYKKLKKIVGNDRYTKLIYDNPKCVLDNKDIVNIYLEKENNW